MKYIIVGQLYYRVSKSVKKNDSLIENYIWYSKHTHFSCNTGSNPLS